ncbi:MAG: ADP-ribosylglycohydrolase family protein [Candidatus Saganbacteria bacterium]|nr:ADP-ribosylglycohydrolase family protein [Candidatus Saganbacteria bacterium]
MKTLPVNMSRIPQRIERFRGSVLAGASGDALGQPLEGKTPSQIMDLHGRVDRYVNNPKKPLGPGQWTDDTAFKKATLISIVKENRIDVDDIRFRMLSAFTFEPKRGYGITTRKALNGDRVRRHVPSNGAAMRIGPVALFNCLDLEKLRTDVNAVSRITHQHQDSIGGAMSIAFAIAKAARGQLRPNSIIQETIDFIGRVTNMASQLSEVDRLLADDSVSVEEAVEYIGTRSFALDSVGSAFYLFLKSPFDLSQSLISAVNSGGDTDTIASLTGDLSGAFNGITAIPGRWLSNLEDRNHLDELSCRLEQLVG